MSEHIEQAVNAIVTIMLYWHARTLEEPLEERAEQIAAFMASRDIYNNDLDWWRSRASSALVIANNYLDGQQPRE